MRPFSPASLIGPGPIGNEVPLLQFYVKQRHFVAVEEGQAGW